MQTAVPGRQQQHAPLAAMRPCDFDLWPFDLRVNACRATAVEYMCTEFGVDSSSRFRFRARTHTDIVTDATDDLIHALATGGEG